MAKLLHMPEVAAGSTEAVLSQWLVEEHAGFSAGDPIATVETDKALVEIEAEHDATLAKTLVVPGTTVRVGSPVALLLAPGEQASNLEALVAQLGVDVPRAVDTGGATSHGAGAPSSEDVPAIPAPRTGTAAASAASTAPTAGPPTPASAPAPTATSPTQVPAPRPSAASSAEPTRLFTSPLARRLLKEAGIPLSEVAGTGPNGRIVRKDVERAIAAKAAVARRAPAPQPEPEVAPPLSPTQAPAVRGAPSIPSPSPAAERVPHTRLRRAIAARLARSKQTAPHFYLKGSARIDALLDLRRQVNEVSPIRVSVNDFLIKAAAVAHQRVPELNVVWQEDAMLRYPSVDVGIAIASSRGLVTPVLRCVESLSVSSVAQQVKQFVERADEGRLAQRDLEGGTLTISNLGMYGVEEFAAIINPPQAAILAVGAGRREPVVDETGSLGTATVLRTVLSVDHRAVDGADAARWMGEFVKAVEQPMLTLL